MADLLCSASVPAASVTSTAATFILLKAPANQRVKIKGLEIFGKGTSNTDTPVKVELLTATAISGGTAGTAPTVLPQDTEMAETIQTTATGNYSAEPTYTPAGGNVLRTWYIHPQTGAAVYLPMHDEIKLKGGTYLGVRLTSNQSETFGLNVIFEE
jgi:hypothetical protein